MVTTKLPDSLDHGAGGRIYAIGDVHGHADKLIAMHEAIRRDLQSDPAPSPMLIHLGDYIDRGPDSALCLSMLAGRPPLSGVPTINLMGNHESMLLDALNGPSLATVGLWLHNGGDMALESWGVPREAPAERWAELIPPAQLALLRGLRLTYATERYLFVHAGVRPGVALAAQRPHDLLWIREQFLNWEGPMLPEAPDRIVVHGHTPAWEPELRPNRIGIDTNAARGGPLTCVVLDAGPPRFIQV
ncbi:MAG TPA: metallophosphoesterase [Acetobacteraceae bacterium]|nr:metallophosphoesterase [Acetobacteraceae bacterium]